MNVNLLVHQSTNLLGKKCFFVALILKYRHDHTVEVLVRPIQCPEIPNKRGLKVNVNDTKLGTKIQLSCLNGNSLIGASELTCMPSGNWSSPLPVCESKC